MSLPVDTHDAILGGATCLGDGHDAGPFVLQRTEQDFLAAVLRGLATPEGRVAVARSRASEPAGADLLLYQPVHRTYHLALVELSCDAFGRPRLDPSRLDGAGLVIRRLGLDGGLEGWMKGDGGIVGWTPLATGRELDQDPDPSRRPPERSTGHAELDRLLRERNGPAVGPLAESTSPLFLAPKEVVEATRRTVLLGVVPVTSPESRDAAPRADPFDVDDVAAHLSPYLKPGLTLSLPAEGVDVGLAQADDSAKWAGFLALLRQVVVELGAAGDSVEARALVEALDAIRLDPGTPGERGAGTFLLDAAAVFLRREGSDASPPRRVRMPSAWPIVEAGTARKIAERAKAAMDRRISVVLPREGRYADPSRRYQVRAFARIKGHDGCPPRLVWGLPGPTFAIAPWYAAGAVPPPIIALPDIDRDSVKSLTPNVTFRVPPGLQSLVEGTSLRGMLDGDAGGGGGIGLGWLCSFSLPIITLCAFLVLNLFLKLFDIVFWWMAFIKICLPIPVPKKK